MIGADPEIFVVDSANGEIIPSWEFLPSKENKDKTMQFIQNSLGQEIVAADRVGGGVYWDGWQAEFETKADTCNERHMDTIYLALRAIRKKAMEYRPTAKLTLQNVIEVPADILQSTESQYVQFGCKPSFNVYDLKLPLLDGTRITTRSSGGHLHFGIGKQHVDTIEDIVKLLDAIIGVACVSLFANYDNPKRRLFYGLAGEFRLPEHGVEYRTLSNAWMAHPAIAHLVIDVARNTVAMAMSGLRKIYKASETEVIETINNCDVKQARRILRRNEDVLKNLLKLSYEESEANLGYKVFCEGMESIIADPTNLDANWLLTTLPGSMDNNSWRFVSNGTNCKWAYAARTFMTTKKKV